MVRSRLHRRILARHDLWICRRILCRHNPTTKFFSWIRQHSSVGYVTLLNGNAISWRASKTILIFLNAAEAELYSLSRATQEAIYLCKVCIELRIPTEQPDYYVSGWSGPDRQHLLYPKKTDFAIAANTSPFPGALLSNDKIFPLATLSLSVSAAQVCLQTYFARLDPHRALYHSATQHLDTHRCPSHCYQLRRGTPLTRFWFMLALNTQRFATVLTHVSMSSSHSEYLYCVTFYRSDVQSELQSVC